MQVAASYRRKKGVLDAHGKRHKVIAYLALAAGKPLTLRSPCTYSETAESVSKFPKYRDGSIQMRASRGM